MGALSGARWANENYVFGFPPLTLLFLFELGQKIDNVEAVHLCLLGVSGQEPNLG